MPLYAQGYSLAEFLIQTGGRRKYVEFLGDGLQSDDWPGAVHRHYGIQDLSALQNTWLAWVRQGSPLMQPATSAAGVAVELPPQRGLAERQPASASARAQPDLPHSGQAVVGHALGEPRACPLPCQCSKGWGGS